MHGSRRVLVVPALWPFLACTSFLPVCSDSLSHSVRRSSSSHYPRVLPRSLHRVAVYPSFFSYWENYCSPGGLQCFSFSLVGKTVSFMIEAIRVVLRHFLVALFLSKSLFSPAPMITVSTSSSVSLYWRSLVPQRLAENLHLGAALLPRTRTIYSVWSLP